MKKTKHFLGRAIRVRQIRDGTELPPLFEDNSYDFNYQAIKYISEPRKIMPVSEILKKKEFDSKNLKICRAIN